MGKYGNENAAAGGRSSSTADRDRAYGGGWGGGGGGAGGGGGLSKSFGPRYSPTKVRQYDATPSNMAKLLGGTAMGLAAPGIGIGLGPMARDMMGFGFEGFQGMGTGHSYDNKGDFGPSFGAGGVPSRTGVGGNPTEYMNYVRQVKAAQPAQPIAQPQGLNFKPMTWGPTQVSIPGAFDYNTALGSWRYFG